MRQVLFSLPTIHTGSIAVLPLRALAGSSRNLKEKVPYTSAWSRNDIRVSFLDQADRNISVPGAHFLKDFPCFKNARTPLRVLCLSGIGK